MEYIWGFGLSFKSYLEVRGYEVEEREEVLCLVVIFGFRFLILEL